MNERNRIAVIGDHLLITGMRVAGIKYFYTVNSTIEVERAIVDVISKEDIGIVIISDLTASMISSKNIQASVQSSTQPIFIRIPSYNQKSEYKDLLKGLISRAIGISIEKW